MRKAHKTAPDLDVPTLDGGRWRLVAAPPRFSMLVFYRGLQCRVTAPSGRPPMDQMLPGIDMVADRNVPARGEA